MTASRSGAPAASPGATSLGGGLGGRHAQTLLLTGWHPAQLAPPGAVTSLRLVGRGSPPLVLPLSSASFSIGTRGDLELSRAISPYVSARHARIERTDRGVRVIDVGSRNGLYASTTTGRVSTLEVRAGGRFWLADVEILALDAGLEALRPAVATCIGLDDEVRIDRALVLASRGAPLALVGPAGTGAAWLARQIHEHSARRAAPFVVVDCAVIDRAPPPLDHPGTAYVDLDAIPRSAASSVGAVFSAMRRTRLIVGTSPSATRRRLDRLAHHSDTVGVIELVPLARRPQDIVPLLDAHWAHVLGSHRRVAELGDGVHILAEHTWPGNLDELHRQSRRLLALLEYPSLRAAAHSLGIRRQTLSGHLDRLGVRLGRERD